MPAKSTTCTIIPAMRYRDALAMIEWLCDAFGFEKTRCMPMATSSTTHN